MLLDIAILVIVIFFAIAGYFRGFIWQLFRFAGLIAIYLFAWPLGGVIAEHLPFFAEYKVVQQILGAAAAGFLLYLAFALVGSLISWLIVGKEGVLKTVDRVWGAVIGLVQGAIIGFLVLVALQAVPESAVKRSPYLQSVMQESLLLQLMGNYNPLADERFRTELGLDNVTWLTKLTAAVRDPRVREKIAEQPAFRKVVENEKLQRLLKNEEFMKKVREKDYFQLMEDPHFKDLLTDKTFIEQVKQIDFDRAFREAGVKEP